MMMMMIIARILKFVTHFDPHFVEFKKRKKNETSNFQQKNPSISKKKTQNMNEQSKSINRDVLIRGDNMKFRNIQRKMRKNVKLK